MGRKNSKRLFLSYTNIVVILLMGDFSDFNEELRVLVKPDTASIVIRKILKETLKLALKEPQYIKDLKNEYE
ncbi:hypothetical protein [Peribacillus sp. NJ4]|uniref:hypothetical protein n=1 Tax=Peribacillus sp. NJ4 TaxID=3055862 RepID=UPI0025A1467E|nr:hypothetical protein [Peribacillus sp. NJ4]